MEESKLKITWLQHSHNTVGFSCSQSHVV